MDKQKLYSSTSPKIASKLSTSMCSIAHSLASASVSGVADGSDLSVSRRRRSSQVTQSKRLRPFSLGPYCAPGRQPSGCLPGACPSGALTLRIMEKPFICVAGLRADVGSCWTASCTPNGALPQRLVSPFPFTNYLQFSRNC